MTTEKIFIGIDNERIELTGADKEAFLEARRIQQEADALIKQEQLQKIAARQSALAKLAALGLTDEEIAAL
jgi:DNA-binding NarL/FixJ family response regulator